MSSINKKSFPYESVFESLTDGIFIVSEGKIVFCNNILLEWLGATREDVLDQDYIKFIAPEYHNLMLERRRLRSEGIIPPKTVFVELLNINQKDRFAIEISVVHPTSGEWSGYAIGTLKNRNDVKHVEKLLEVSQQSLEEIIS